jgi:hypothetical protein
MKLSKCKSCGLPVLELEGQFEKLDSFFLTEDMPAETAGMWHSRCLVETDAEIAKAWYVARLSNFRDVRRYEEIATLERWTVVQHARTRETIAFGLDGRSLGLSFVGKPRRATGGAVYRIVEEKHNLDLDDESVVASVQQGLSNDGTYPVLALIEALGLSERIVHPEALDRGALHFERALTRHWGKHFVSARMEYGVFVPEELEPYVVAKVGR